MTIAETVDHWAAGHRVPPERNPLAFCLFAAMVVSSGPTAVGLRALPGSLARVPDAVGQSAAVILVLGCLISVVGLVWPNRDTGVSFELAGALVAAVGVLFYGYALIASAGITQAAVAGGLSLGVGIGCFARAGQISLYARGRVLRSQGTASTSNGGQPKGLP